jgi:DNA-damage-inducible protein J
MFLQSQKHHILVVIFEGDLQKRPPDFGLWDLHKEMEVLFFGENDVLTSYFTQTTMRADCDTMEADMAGAVVQVRVDSELKKKAASVFENLGLDLSTAVRMFFTRAVQVGGIPFPTSNIQDKDAYNYEAAIENIMEIRRQSVINGTSDITTEEIDAIIDDYRRSKVKK